MRNTARLTLGIIIVLVAALVIPRSFSRTAFAALIQVTPTLPNIFDSPTPTVDPNKPGGGGNEPGGGGGNEPGGGGGNEPGGGGNEPGGGGKGDGNGKGNDKGKGEDGRNGSDKNKNKKKKEKDEAEASGSGELNRIPGDFNTDKLVAVAARLRSLGMSESEVLQRVFPPFIHGGPTSFIDTWGAPRYGPAPGQVRTHEGQDVFCERGKPVLAPVDGWVDFSNGGLGGVVARVHDPTTNRYFYMAHLEDVNTEQFSSGDQVKVGDVVGYCGNSGNAITTPTHTHFGWYSEDGSNTKNPMPLLVKWLQEAEKRVLGVVTKTTQKRVKNKVTLTAARRFGDAFAPDMSELRIESGSLWASGSDPASGAFVLAESALQAALSTGAETDVTDPQKADFYLGAGNGLPALFDADTGLAQLLEEADVRAEGSD